MVAAAVGERWQAGRGCKEGSPGRLPIYPFVFNHMLPKTTVCEMGLSLARHQMGFPGTYRA